MNLLEKFTPISSLYLHFPFCRELCNYCDFFRNKVSVQGILDYQNYLTSSIKKHTQLLTRNHAVLGDLKTIYIGGGTPSLWGNAGIDYLHELFDQLKVKISSNCEFTLEINPATLDIQELQRWKQLGVNRFSLGVQALDDDLLKQMGRIHNKQQALEAIEVLSSVSDNFSLDLMLGLPELERERDLILELDNFLSYTPKHLSVYILTPKSKYIHLNLLPREELVADEYLKVSDYLRSRGYLHYEVSNFSLENCQSQHNLNYWKGANIAALGPSASGFLVDRNGDSGLRYRWDRINPSLELDHLDSSQLKMERFYLALRTNMGLVWQDFVEEKDQTSFLELLGKWDDANLLISRNPMRLSPNGYLLLDSVMGDIFTEIESL